MTLSFPRGNDFLHLGVDRATGKLVGGRVHRTWGGEPRDSELGAQDARSGAAQVEQRILWELGGEAAAAAVASPETFEARYGPLVTALDADE